ncbi:unnamed protein product [Clavelina lepadiformis]|uniref:Sulfatase N-terminal domain-containing protein n=1 Tax=Clavelina lepadiformis TaxID=159417 RepID=A0ABP0G3I8_CLALP
MSIAFCLGGDMMNCNVFVVLFIWLSVIQSTLSVVSSLKTEASIKRPNVLFLVIDDLRPALGCYDYPKVISPNIDQLASRSVLFENAHVQQTVCGPSRTSFLTSRRPDTTRLYDFGSYWRTHAGNFTSLPQHFKENGYFTYSIGKVFHPGICSNHNDDYPLSWSKPAYHPSTQAYMMAKVCPDADGKRYMNLLCPVDVSTQPEGSLPDIQSSEHAVDMLKEFQADSSEQPFFLAVGFHKPHLPFKFPKDFLKLYPLEEIDLAPNPFKPIGLPDVAFSPYHRLRIRHDFELLNVSFPYGHVPDTFQKRIRQHYYSSVSYTDSRVGIVLNQLEDSGFANNTIIVLLGDHGWSLGEHAEWCKNENFEVVTRIPLMVHMPGMTDINLTNEKKFPFQDVLKSGSSQRHKIERGPRSTALVEAVDVFPTLAELAGLKVLPTCPLDTLKVDFCTEGASLSKLMMKSAQETYNKEEQFLYNDMSGDNEDWKDAVFSQYPRPSVHPQWSSDLPDLKDIKIMGYTMRTRHHRYTEWVAFNPATFQADFNSVYARELYLRDSDPLEVYNVGNLPMYEDLVMKMRKKLIAGWREALPK